GAGLLELDGGAGLLEVGLELVGVLSLCALLDRLGRLVDQRLGLLEAQARRGPHDLDHLDLLVARALQHDVERRLLLGGLTAGSASPPTSPCSSICRSWRATPAISAFSPRTSPVIGAAIVPTSCACRTSRTGSRAIARISSTVSVWPSSTPPLNSSAAPARAKS